MATSFGPPANSEICLISTWTITFTLASDIVPGDHIIVKFLTPSRFTFLRTGATSPIGTVVIIDHTLLGTPLSVSPVSIQYFIIVTTTLTAGSPVSFDIAGIRNANDPTPGVALEMIYWQGKSKTKKLTFPLSPVWQDGGIVLIVNNHYNIFFKIRYLQLKC